MKKVTKIIAGTALFGASLFQPSYSQVNDDFRRPRSDLESIVKKQNLSEERRDSVVSHWLPLYKKTGGATRKYSLPDSISASTKISKNGSSLLSYQPVKSNNSSKIIISSYDLGSINEWAEKYDVPKYAKNTIFESMNEYYSTSNKKQAKNKKNKQSKHQIKSEKTKEENYSSYLQDYYSNTTYSFDRENEKTKQQQEVGLKTKNPHNKWSAGLFFTTISKQNNTTIGASISRSVVSKKNYQFYLRAEIPIISDLKKQYQQETVTYSNSTEYENANTSMTITEMNGWQKNREITELGIMFKGGKSDDVKMTIYAGGSVYRNSYNHITSQEKTFYYSTFSSDEAIGQSVSQKKEITKEPEMSVKGVIGLGIDYKKYGCSVIYQQREDEPELLLEGRVNF
ncbi:MAG: hypothetical protein ACQESC_02275 [Nanobdellota archaeon]